MIWKCSFLNTRGVIPKGIHEAVSFRKLLTLHFQFLLWLTYKAVIKVSVFQFYILMYDVTENMRIWFRHSGQPPVDWTYVYRANTKFYTAAEVKREVGSYDITDLKLKGKIPNNIGEIAGKALHLHVSELTDRASLDK